MRYNFQPQIKALREEIVSCITELIMHTEQEFYDFPEDVDYCEKVWQICYDKNGEPYEAYVTRVEIKHGLTIYAEDCYDRTSVTNTKCNCEAMCIDFLERLYNDLYYYVKEYGK